MWIYSAENHGGQYGCVIVLHAGAVGFELMNHVQFPSDEPKYRINPEQAQDNLHEGLVPGMFRFDVVKFVPQYTASFGSIGRNIPAPEYVAKE